MVINYLSQKANSATRYVVITLDKMPASSEKLETLVVELCSQYGSVSRVKIHSDTQLKPVAWVEMATTQDTLELKHRLGELIVDDTVLIRIERR